MQERLERARVDGRNRFRRAQETLVDGVDREAHGGLRGPLGGARLEHVETALLDSELGVLHVPEVTLELAQQLPELGVDLGHPAGELMKVARGPHAGYDVLALSVDQEVAAGLRRTGHLVAREGDA